MPRKWLNPSWNQSFSSSGAWRKDLFHNDVHPYDDGSEVIARVVAEWLLASKLLPGG